MIRKIIILGHLNGMLTNIGDWDYWEENKENNDVSLMTWEF